MNYAFLVSDLRSVFHDQEFARSPCNEPNRQLAQLTSRLMTTVRRILGNTARKH